MTLCLELRLDSEICNQIYDLSADVVLYGGDKPISVIEVKKFAEGAQIQKVKEDLEKDKGVFCTHADKYLVVLICETAGEGLDERTQRLEEKMKIYAPTQIRGNAEPTLSGKDWKWRMWCAYAK